MLFNYVFFTVLNEKLMSKYIIVAHLWILALSLSLSHHSTRSLIISVGNDIQTMTINKINCRAEKMTNQV